MGRRQTVGLKIALYIPTTHSRNRPKNRVKQKIFKILRTKNPKISGKEVRMMCETLNIENIKIEVSKRPSGKMLGLATIQIMEMRIKGFVIAEGPDRNSGEVNKYVTPPKAGTHRPGKKPTEYFFLEDPVKWKRLQERILEEYEIPDAPFHH